MSKITIVAQLVVKKEHREELLKLCEELVPASRAEAGNSYYDLYEDLKNPLAFTVLELWDSAKAIEEHNATPHFKKLIQFVEDKKLESLNIHQLKQVM
jgi:quinol monooxygenase YgiN